MQLYKLVFSLVLLSGLIVVITGRPLDESRPKQVYLGDRFSMKQQNDPSIVVFHWNGTKPQNGPNVIQGQTEKGKSSTAQISSTTERNLPLDQSTLSASTTTQQSISTIQSSQYVSKVTEHPVQNQAVQTTTLAPGNGNNPTVPVETDQSTARKDMSFSEDDQILQSYLQQDKSASHDDVTTAQPISTIKTIAHDGITTEHSKLAQDGQSSTTNGPTTTLSPGQSGAEQVLSASEQNSLLDQIASRQKDDINLKEYTEMERKKLFMKEKHLSRLHLEPKKEINTGLRLHPKFGTNWDLWNNPGGLFNN